MPLDGTLLHQFPEVQVLLDAKQIIKDRGWVRGEFGVRGGPRCVVGAIQEAARDRDSWGRCDGGWAAGYAYGTALGIPSIEIWQDFPRRTLEEVLDGFDRAVERAIELRFQRAAA